MSKLTGVATPSQIEIRRSRFGVDRAFIVGTRITVADVFVMNDFHGYSPEEIAAKVYSHLTLGQVYSALGYFYDHAEKILAQMQEVREYAERMRAELGPGPLEWKRLAGEVPKSL